MKKALVIAGAAAGAGVIAWLAYSTMYASPARALRSKLAAHASRNEQFERLLLEAPQVRKELRARSAEALAGPTDQAEHVLRGMIHGIATRAGLQEPVVSSGGVTYPANPYARARRVGLTSLRKPMGAQRDFGVVGCELRGLGDLGQSMRTLALVQGQPWVQRVTGFSIRPRNEDRTLLELRVAFEVLYIPEYGSAEVRALAPTDDESAPVWAGIVSKNVFRYVPPAAPPPPVVVPVVARQDPPPPPAPAYHDWRITGIAVTGTGAEARVEVTLYNASSHTAMVLQPGGTVLGARLVEASGERAVFEVEGASCEVRLGENLAQRRPVQA
ncbi:MAG: hypothetical protein IT439_08590 [Phycisphaerales bacterium]|nr:hypothetical protein [Phycisphaerales bacterium]